MQLSTRKGCGLQGPDSDPTIYKKKDPDPNTKKIRHMGTCKLGPQVNFQIASFIENAAIICLVRCFFFN